MLFKNVLEMWLHDKKAYIKASTYAYYHYEVQNYIIPMMGNKKTEDLTEEYIQNIVLQWQNQGMENGHPLKKSTVQNLVMLIKQVLKFAEKKGIIGTHKIEIHFAPQIGNKRIQVFSKEDEQQLIHAILDELNYKTFGILLCMNSGLRIGELCALKWNDIDIPQKILHVTKTLQRIYMKDMLPKTQIIISTPKTFTSVRDIPLSDKICGIIKKFHNIDSENYILSNNVQFIEPRTFRKFYANFLVSHGINVLNFHCLRHTFATRCIENGADYKIVSEILGHTTITTTLNMYVHPAMDEKRKCVDMLMWD